MKIVVCIKQVPDTTEVKLDPEKGTLIRTGIPSIINPDDKRGLEAALVLKEQVGAEVTVLTMGPPQADVALRESFAMGVDRAILLTDRKFAGSDTLATSHTLAAALRKLDADLIIAGRQAIDGDTAQVGPQIAEHLHLPQVSYVYELEKEDDQHLLVKRSFEDGYHRLRIKMPCLITTLSEMNIPRYMSVGKIFDAYREKEVEVWNLEHIEIDPARLGLDGSPTKVKKSFTKSAKEKGLYYDNVTPKEAVQLIVDKLKEKFIL
ncbi:electron transfer flavoprotein subunit beta/FixA family protein [Pelobacter seleniigenes]|uniref:electron transfer flavoprotein subunit beta/FixA family protein n=1 Tax=Pelobacter seleniigenes TaxID=407188 RepID=UPI0004A7111F|nr:electron transfer flavoprotein subunit beta/FixA family protein [Pelobacter seleniigenes]